MWLSIVSLCFFFSSRRRHTRYWRDWSSDVCSSDLPRALTIEARAERVVRQRLPGGSAWIEDPVPGPVQLVALRDGEQAFAGGQESSASAGRRGELGPGVRLRLVPQHPQRAAEAPHLAGEQVQLAVHDRGVRATDGQRRVGDRLPDAGGGIEGRAVAKRRLLG